MAARPTKKIQNALIETWTVTAAATATQYMPATLTAEKTARDSTSGENCSAIFLETKAAGEKVQVAILAGGAVIPVKVGVAGATQGGYAEVGTTGLVDRTLGGGTTVRYIAGKFLETGVSGDIVGMIAGQFAGVSS